jgi:phosphatidylserine/phosphatidylglycerophosphate/cardiolipin synthase-like enzyme
MIKLHSRRFSIALSLLVLAIVAACVQQPAAPVIPTSVPPTVEPSPTSTESRVPTWLRVYFTNPDPPDQIDNGLDKVFVAAIDGAKLSVDVVSFDFNLPSVIDALVNAAKRGVKVRVVLDGKSGAIELSDDAAKIMGGRIPLPLDVLKAASIPVVDGGRDNGLMHNKFLIIDSNMMFVGSANVSYNDTFRNNNNLLRITSQRIITNYEDKFAELFEQKLFGTKSKVGARYPQLSFSGAPVENYFSPVDKVGAKLVAEVSRAQKSIKFMAFTYTAADLAAVMIARARAGVQVVGVIENRGASQGVLPQLFCAGLPIRTDGNKYTMHHKVIIIDDETVITGSYNFTKSADTINDENIIIIRNAAVAALYTKEFDKIYGGAKPPTTVTCS